MNDHILLLDFLGMPDCLWRWVLASLGAFLLGWLLHWLLFCKKLKNQIDELTVERDDFHNKFTTMEKDFVELKYKYDELEKDNNGLKASLRLCEADKSILTHKLGKAESALAAGVSGGEGNDYGSLLGTDYLQIVEGIGPKIEELLKNAGIKDWAGLAAANIDKLKSVLDEAGSRYKMHDPKSWPKQAKMAVDGKWDELVEFQKLTDAGRENSENMETPAKVEKLLVKKLGFSTDAKDLKIVEGIGPKIEGLLKEAGIKNRTDLSNTGENTLQGILNKAGDRYKLADPSTWAKQAGLAADGKWAALKKLQDLLQGGKNPK